jgi:selenocysteine-specific elongation factor SelB
MATHAQQPLRHVIIGTAGHVDHGKTTLIRALTGIETDRLAEEKARGMTIDLGFAFLDLPGTEAPIRAGIVDVPGHERFVKNMLAGAGGVDVALLVVAADEGPMPQTREHLDILTVLGVSRGVVALTKADLADDELRELAAETAREVLTGTPLEGAPLVALSAETGEGLDTLRAALARAAADVPPRDPRPPFRLPVDRVFSLPGVGTVVTGTLLAGTLRVGDAVSVQPQGLATKARTLQSHSARVEVAEPGMRVAVNLPGIEVGQVERGAVLCPPGALAATTLIDVRLSLLPNAPRPLKHRERVRVHLGTGEVLARALLLEGAEVAPGIEGAAVQLLCETPAAPARGERFVVRTYSPARAIGGGTVRDPAPARRYRRGDATALALFEAKEEDTVQSVYAALAARHADFSVAEIAAAAGLEPDVATVALESLVDEGRAEVLTDGRYLSDVAARRLSDTARRIVSQYHRQNPYRKAMPREGLRAPLAKAATVRDFNALLAWLVAQGVVVNEGALGVRLPEHEVTLSPKWQAAADEMLAVFDSAGLQPPSPGNFQANYPNDVNVVTILNVLTEQGRLFRIGDDLYISAGAMDAAKQMIRKLAETPEGVSVGTLRDATGSSRKVILPLLEYLDAQRFTRRVGDVRVLAEGSGPDAG